ncbi:unnamed protein product [Euphydryas editha]|nr:unnamed protein product [Euphydryas editha]
MDRSNITLRPRRNNVFEVNLMELDVPVSYNEAINSKASELWLEAINEELEALCARGFTQIDGINYYESIRILLSISAEYNWNLRQLDIKTAFLYGDLEEDVFMVIPDGVKAPENKICKLNKSLYGLKTGISLLESKVY